MNKIELERVDRLNELIEEMEAILYVHKLAQDDIDHVLTMGGKLDWTQRIIFYYLLDLHTEVITRIRELINSKEFRKTTEDTDDQAAVE